MPITKRELKEILTKLRSSVTRRNEIGFTEIRSKHHIFFELRISNRIIRTKISHGSERDISDALLSHILKEQIYLTKEEFESAKRGQFSEKDYLEILKKKRIIENNAL